MNVLNMNQQPLGSQFPSYELNSAPNYWTLDPFQYSITKFHYNNFDQNKNDREVDTFSQDDFKNDPGLVYKDVNFEELLPSYTQVKRSQNDVPAQDYHRFLANDGYFNPKEGTDNKDLWYYGANNVLNNVGYSGAAVNVQEVNHIIFPEPQRGGLDTRNLTKYSTVNSLPINNKVSWENQNRVYVNNDQRCKLFDYNSGYTVDKEKIPFETVYSFDSNYCRSIGISSPFEGSMPFKFT